MSYRCVMVTCRVMVGDKTRKPTTRGIPRRSPIQVLTPPDNRCFPCGIVVDREIIAKICCLIRGIEREGYLSSWLVGGCRATQGGVTTAVRREGLLLCCVTCRLAFWARQSGLQ